MDIRWTTNNFSYYCIWYCYLRICYCPGNNTSVIILTCLTGQLLLSLNNLFCLISEWAEFLQFSHLLFSGFFGFSEISPYIKPVTKMHHVFMFLQNSTKESWNCACAEWTLGDNWFYVGLVAKKWVHVYSVNMCSLLPFSRHMERICNYWMGSLSKTGHKSFGVKCICEESYYILVLLIVMKDHFVSSLFSLTLYFIHDTCLSRMKALSFDFI